MATNVGLKLGIDGEAQYKAEINNIIQQAKTLDAEMKAVTSSFTKETTAEEKSAKTSAVLSKQIDTQREKLAKQNEMLEKAVQKYGEADTRTLSWKEAVNNTTATLNRMENELRGVNSEVEETGEEMKQGADAGLSFGDVLKANVAGQAIVKGVEALASAMKKVVTEIVNAAKESLQWADDLATLSVQTGLSTEQLQEFQYMADLIDTDVSTITGSLARLTRNMNSAKDGTGSAAEAFDALGVSIKGDNDELRDNYDVFLDLIDALGQVENDTERDALAMSIFGKGAQELNTLVAVGSDGLRAYAEEAHAVGAVMSDDALGGMLEAKDAVDRLSASWGAFKNSMIADIAPGISSAVESILGLIRGDTTLDDFLADFQTKADELAENMPELISNIVTKITENLPQIIAAGLNILSSLAIGIFQALPSLIGQIPDIIFGIVEGLLSALPAILEAGQQLLYNLILGMINYYAEMNRKAQEIGDQVVKWIWDGISGAMTWIKAKITEWVGNVLEFIKKLFGIGAGGGYSGTMGVVADTGGASSVQSVYNSGAFGASTQSVGGVVFNITQREGEDSYALAQRINRQLGRIYAGI